MTPLDPELLGEELGALDGRDARDIVTGAANAFGSNFPLGLGRQSGNSDFAKAQFLGDLASVPAGYLWGDTGATIATLGVAGAPETGGATPGCHKEVHQSL